MKSHGRGPAAQRPQSGPRPVMPRTPSKRTQPQRERAVRTRVARVNQKMVDRMVKLRQQGFSYEEIGDQVGCGERTVRRHTEGVSPQLVHAGDQTRVSLLQWGAQEIHRIQQDWSLSVPEFDLVLKRLRQQVSALDEMTIAELERDPDLRARFLTDEVWPPAHEKIDDLRLERDIEPTKWPRVTTTRRV